MPVSYQILPQCGLAYLRLSGVIDPKEALSAFEDYLIHPDYAPGQKQLIDMSAMTDYKRDYTALMQVQARKAAAFVGGRTETLIVFHCPTQKSCELARLIERSWVDVPYVVLSLQPTEEHALAILGLREQSFDALLEGAS